MRPLLRARGASASSATIPKTGILVDTVIQRFRQRIWRRAAGDNEPVVLRHSRIYILPTRRGWALVLTLILMLLTSMNYGLNLGYALTFLLSAMMAAGLLQTFRNLLGITLRPIEAGTAFLGQSLQFQISLSEGADFPRKDISVHASGASPALVDIPACGSTTTSLLLTPSHRGWTDLGRIVVSSDFALGLWGAFAYAHFPLRGLVYPAPEIPPPPLPDGAGGDKPSARSVTHVEADLAGLREHQASDPISRVAWKAVARGRGWYTKQFDHAPTGEALALDWDSLPATLEPETRLSRLTAWLIAAERERRPYSLAAPGIFIPFGQGEAHRDSALAALAVFGTDSHASQV